LNFRLYSKSLLFSNRFKLDNVNKELYVEYKSNIALISKYFESYSDDLKSIADLKNKNVEIEKFLSENTKPLANLTLKDLKNKLAQDEAYIEIIRINKQSQNLTQKAADIVKLFTDSISYGAIIIKKNRAPEFILIDDSNKLEKQYVTVFKSKIQNRLEDTESYHLLFEKIDNELKDIKKIYLVTDGVYNSINIESIYNPNKKQYLIDYLKIQPIQNVRAITDEKKEFKIGLNTKTILYGNPDFDLLIADSKTNGFSLDRSLDNNALDEIKSRVKISRLDGTQKEIETLDVILKDSKSNVEIFSKADATEDNLKNIQSPDILHIATHGYFLTNDDNSKTKQSIANLINESYKKDSYLKSGLLLAGAQNTLNGKQPENSNNGILTAEEAKNLDLKNTELVVLSACETGLGDNLVGEGVIGLQRAFMIAGAKSVIMSLWSVSDSKTQELMTLFYTNWIKKNMSKEEGLYQAKIEMKRLYPQPYYWAGFVLLE
jgi:CHAT domain-containing protein